MCGARILENTCVRVGSVSRRLYFEIGIDVVEEACKLGHHARLRVEGGVGQFVVDEAFHQRGVEEIVLLEGVRFDRGPQLQVVADQDETLDPRPKPRHEKWLEHLSRLPHQHCTGHQQASGRWLQKGGGGGHFRAAAVRSTCETSSTRTTLGLSCSMRSP